MSIGDQRVHSSAALQSHSIWTETIGDPYAPVNRKENSLGPSVNLYDRSQGLLELARLTKKEAGTGTRGACKKCGAVGHLTFQCRNTLNSKDANKNPPDGSSKDSSGSDEDSKKGESSDTISKRLAKDKKRKKDKKHKKKKDKKQKKKRKRTESTNSKDKRKHKRRKAE